MKGRVLLVLSVIFVGCLSGCFPYYTYESALLCTEDGRECQVISEPVLNYPTTNFYLGYDYYWNHPYPYRGYHHQGYGHHHSPRPPSHWPPRHYSMGSSPGAGPR